MKSIFLTAVSLTLLFLSSIPMLGSNDNRAVRLFSDPEIVTGSYTGFCMDHDGYLWIGSDAGLLRFDGNVYDTYRHDDDIPGTISDNRILHLLCDTKGRMWVATANGLNLYNPDTDSFTLITIPEKGLNGYVIGLVEQIDGTVTFIVSGVGLYIIDDSEPQPTAVRYLLNTPGEKEFSYMTSSPDGRLYIAAHNGAVCIVSPNGNSVTIPVSSDYINNIVVDNNGYVLLSTINDLYRLDTSTNTLTRLFTYLGRKITINNISCRNDGTAIIATQGQGLWQLAPGSNMAMPDHSIYSSTINLDRIKIGTTYVDSDENLWLGCNFHGVILVPSTPIPFLYRSLKDVLPSFGGGLNALASVGGKILVSLDSGNIMTLNPDGTKHSSTKVVTGNDATSIIAESETSALVGVANDGIYRMDINSGKMSQLVHIEGKYPGVRLCMDNDGDVYAGLHGVGLLRYNPTTGKSTWYKNENNDSKLSNHYIADIYHSADNKIWIGLYSGVACFDCDADSLIKIEQQPFLKGATFAFEDGPDGAVYIGTSQGLMLFHPTKGVIRKFSTSDGLSDHDVRSLTTDSHGGLWIGTMYGLSYLPPESDKIISYHGGYGLTERHFTYAITSPTDGHIYFGNDSGITSFLPEAVSTPAFDSNVMVSALYVNGVKVTPATMSGKRAIIKGKATSPTDLYLTHNDNSMVMRLSTMDFRDASNVRYKWQIKELNNSWHRTMPGENIITLPPLEPGEYTLHLKACENNISSPTTEIKIHIAAPWYISTVAKALYLAILLTIIVLSFTVMKKKREEKINDAKIKFFMDISHDIRSPVTLILSPLDSLLKQPLEPEVTAKLHTMRRNAHRLLSLVNQLLDLRKIEKGKMRLTCSPTDMCSFVGELVEMYESQAEAKHISMEFKCDEELPKVSVDRDNFDKILVNLISNAIKYTPEGGNIQVALGMTDDSEIGHSLEIRVTDTGIGLDNKSIAHIFDRFYRARENHADSSIGFGIGLDLCRRLVMLHNGTISAANRTDGVKGSVFTVHIPINSTLSENQEANLGGDNPLPENHTETKHLLSSYHTTDGTLPSHTKSKYSNSNQRILIVDDDEELREYIKSHLSGSYKVSTASNGAEAMKMILEKVPDLVVSDVMMPEMDGLTLLKQLKSNAATHHVPVILLSSKSDIADRIAGWNRGADGYIGKPFQIEELDIMIDNIIDNRLKLKGKFSGAQDNDDKIATPEMKGNDEALMDKIMTIINEHINDPMLNVEMLGKEVGISRAHLHRKMKELIGMTPSDFIRNVRLRRACELLKKPDIDITQVAYTLGFTSQPHFSTAFKRFTGVTPTEYRSMNTQNKSPKMPI